MKNEGREIPGWVFLLVAALIALAFYGARHPMHPSGGDEVEYSAEEH